MDLIGPLFCQVCNVAIPHENARESHNQGKKHQLTLHTALTEDKNYNSTVFSKGWPNAVNKKEILNFVAKYGEVESYFMPQERMWMITKFKDVSVAQNLIKQGNTKFYGRTITFSAKTRQEPQPRPPPQEENTYEPILKIIFNQQSFGDEVTALCAILQPDCELSFKKYMHLCADLEKCLQCCFHYARVHPFGSTITGLAFRDSDVDAFIQVPNRAMFPPNRVFHVEAVNVARELLNRTLLFTDIVSIPRASTPIVKCVHLPTGVKCDFNFKNMLGVCNSYFIQFVVRLDPKLKLCLMVLKFWSKVRLAGVGNNRLTNYALAMMFIYYLQQEPYKLPSLRKLQENPAVTNMQDGWNGGFDAKASIDMEAIRNSSITDILHGFFKLYINFDYNTLVISPYLGRSVEKTCFASLEVLPEEFRLYRASYRGEHLKVDSVMCMQDPFEHNRNLVAANSHRFMNDFLDELKRAEDIFKVQNPHLLYNLCSEEYDNVLKHVVRIKLPKQRSLLFLVDTIPSSSNLPSSDLKRAWFHFVDMFLIDVLREVFMFTISLNKDEDSHNTPKKMKPTVDLLNLMMDRMHITCSGLYNLWDARGALRDDPLVEESSTFLDGQVKISKYIHGTLLSNVRPKEPIVNLNVTVEHHLADTHVMITLEAADQNYENRHFGSFASCFCKFFPSWLVQQSKERNAPYLTNGEREKTIEAASALAAEVKIENKTDSEKT